MRPRPEQNAMLHTWAATGVAVITFGIVGGLYYQAEAYGAGPRGPALEDLEVIEASIAYKKTEKKQPQKKKRAPNPAKPDEGVRRDDTKPDPPKKDEPDDPVAKPETGPADSPVAEPDDTPVGKPELDVGEFNPDAPVGWAEETKGDPYFQKLLADLREGWEYPELLGAEGVPVGCMRLEKDGSVSDTLFKEQSGTPELDDSVERALKKLEQKREKNPPPVPEHLLKHTTRWICFKFEV